MISAAPLTSKTRTARRAGEASRELPLYVAIVGHVDHGKSTLVGRLLNDAGALPAGKVEAVEEMCRRRGMPFEWAFVTDALQAERDQGVTIDVSHIRLKLEARDYVLVDAPGHREFLRNTISGAAMSDGALLVIDAAEGVQEQSRRHGYLLHLLGLRQVAVAVNKMDVVDYSAERFADIENEYREYLGEVGIDPVCFVPVSAREGDNIVERSTRMSWYLGPTVGEALATLPATPPLTALPTRLPIQDIYKFDTRRILAGRIESGRLAVGDEVLFSPSNKTTRIKSIESWSTEAPVEAGYAGQSVGVTLEEQLFVERGEIMSLADHPPVETDVFRARIFWLGDRPLKVGSRYTLKLHTMSIPVQVQAIERVIDTGDLSSAEAGKVERDAVAEVILRARSMMALDSFSDNPRTGRFALVDGYDVCGGGIVNMEGYPDQRELVTVRSTNITAVEHRVSGDMRALRNTHRGGVLWFTGLSGSGKTTLAIELEQRLFRKGYQVYVLDGDNIRGGLNANLGFSPEDRAENIRRVGEVAGLFADAGMIVVSAFISPYRSDRERARHAAGGEFHEIYIEADLTVCEERDPKGLYKKARSGEIEEFTGISAPYEAPADAQLVVNTGTHDVDASVRKIMDYVEKHFAADLG